MAIGWLSAVAFGLLVAAAGRRFAEAVIADERDEDECDVVIRDRGAGARGCVVEMTSGFVDENGAFD